jgi:myotubularin-related protein 6/7/8
LIILDLIAELEFEIVELKVEVIVELEVEVIVELEVEVIVELKVEVIVELEVDIIELEVQKIIKQPALL